VIRPLQSDDYPGLVRLLRMLRADSIYTPAGMQHLIESMPERAANAAWVADEGGVAGWAWAHRRWQRRTNTAYAWVGVLPEARGRGIGRELWERAQRHVASLGVTAFFTDVVGDPAGERFVVGQGFTPSRTDVVSAVDVRAVDLAGLDELERRAATNGYRLTTIRQVDPHGLYRLDLALGDDTPGADAPHDVSFEEWSVELAHHPDLNWDASAAVLHDNEPVAECLLIVDEEGRRARNEGTGTLQGHRRRGLATLTKLAAIRWAAEHGIETIITDNDERNAGMLAINERLGYRPLVERRRWKKELDG
jgi:GNAT superfamily N-acetyltransferase